MKKLLVLICFICFSISAYSQQSYTIDGETLELKTEVDGTLDLLWNVIDGKYRYFIRNEAGDIQELTNSKDDTNNYREEYKTTLMSLTGGSDISTEKINLTLYDLKTYLNDFNLKSDTNYTFQGDAKLKSRLGVFGGITNSPFVDNINNSSSPFFGVEFEFFEQYKLPRHALFFNFRHALEQGDFKYSETQLAFGYRFRVINKSAFSFYVNVIAVTYTSSKETKVDFLTALPFEVKNSGINIPMSFGLGADIKIVQNGFVTLAYNELVALFIDNKGNFPIHFAIGYKHNL